MDRINYILTILIFGLFILIASSCTNKSKNTGKQTENNKMVKNYNPVVYFEIPVTDIDRAIKFYKSVFNFTFEKDVIDKNEMALFPFADENAGISGALAKGEIYKPTKDGVVIYFNTLNIDETLKLAVENGGQVLYPKTSNGDLGFVAEFEDCEGNRIALHQSVN
jgi:predicted enzyme related to lactoylglutathione lyase